MRKYISILFTFMLFAFGSNSNIQAQTSSSDLPLSTENDTEFHGGRSADVVPSATLDGTELTLSYPLSTESQVIIIDQSTQATVYTETFAATRSLNIDLEEEGLPDGSYTLRIYAFGKWWVGEFVIE